MALHVHCGLGQLSPLPISGDNEWVAAISTADGQCGPETRHPPVAMKLTVSLNKWQIFIYFLPSVAVTLFFAVSVSMFVSVSGFLSCFVAILHLVLYVAVAVSAWPCSLPWACSSPCPWPYLSLAVFPVVVSMSVSVAVSVAVSVNLPVFMAVAVILSV